VDGFVTVLVALALYSGRFCDSANSIGSVEWTVLLNSFVLMSFSSTEKVLPVQKSK